MNDLRQVIHTVRSLCDRVAAIESKMSSQQKPLAQGYDDRAIKKDIKEIKEVISLIRPYNDKPLVMRIEKLESFDVKAVVNLDYVNSLYRG